MGRGSTSVGTEEVCALFFWDSQIRPLVPWPMPAWQEPILLNHNILGLGLEC